MVATILPPPLDIQHVHRDTARTVLRAVGEIDLGTCATLHRCLIETLRHRDGGEVVVDVSEVSFLSAAGINTLLACRAAARRRGVALVLDGPPPPVYRVLDVTGLLDVLGVRRGLDRPDGRD
ncbi:hypothetical protein GCM10010124_27730 [Pilimelia terevasa]|uniref:Anti-sigma factor antagonist n=1 Tax=Pilimelia terevasa TaxID=53372 RepID=A0A8J3FKI5_9ACTN|nr:anti-sigma factor antagonist [Pilimelia terevasa]GGK33467.1 hypothetical protein GCM10010124_27730 [Pilimelia terevasa]